MIPMICKNCSHAWEYKGKSRRCECPRCGKYYNTGLFPVFDRKTTYDAVIKDKRINISISRKAKVMLDRYIEHMENKQGSKISYTRAIVMLLNNTELMLDPDMDKYIDEIKKETLDFEKYLRCASVGSSKNRF